MTFRDARSISGCWLHLLIFLKIKAMCVSRSVVPDSLRPHGLQPTRFLCPSDFSRQGYWSGSPFPSPGDLRNPRIKPRSPTLQADSLPNVLEFQHFDFNSSTCKMKCLWLACRKHSDERFRDTSSISRCWLHLLIFLKIKAV